MTAEQAKALGYRVEAASAFEVGLLKNNMGIRTWWACEFGGKLPTLEHPRIQEAIRITEGMHDPDNL